MPGYTYPYASKTAQEVAEAKEQGIPVVEWHRPGTDLAAIIGGLKGNILEIGGPTDSGYYFLHSITLPTPVIITNLKADGMPFAWNKDELNKHIAQLVDGRHLPYPNDSLAMVLSAHLSLADDSGYDFANLSDEEDKLLNELIAKVEAAEKHAAETGHVDDATLQISLRLAIAAEVYAKLQTGGIYMTDATADQVQALQALGFTKLAELEIHQLDPLLKGVAPYYHIALQK
jgi:hypothetical protein